MSETDKKDSVEVGAACALAQAATLPLMTVLLAEAEALAALMPGEPASDQRKAAPEDDPFDNMPV